MKKIMTGIVLIGLLAFGAVGVAQAQEATPPGDGGYGGHGGFGHGHFGQNTEDNPLHDYMVAAFAAALDIDASELETRIANGETMYDIATELGYAVEDLRDLMLTARQVAFEQAVTDGVIDADTFGQGFGPDGQGGRGQHGGGRSGGHGPGNGGCNFNQNQGDD